MKMNKRVKKLILNALRSGEYKQTQGVMKRVTSEDSYCIMSLFCHIYQKEKGIPDNAWTPLKNSLNGFEWKDMGCTIPDEVAKWAGINGFTCLQLSEGVWRSLMILNDSDKITFPQFADLIEEQL